MGLNNFSGGDFLYEICSFLLVLLAGNFYWKRGNWFGTVCVFNSKGDRFAKDRKDKRIDWAVSRKTAVFNICK